MCYQTESLTLENLRYYDECVEREMNYLSQNPDALGDQFLALHVEDVDQVGPLEAVARVQGVHPESLRPYTDFRINRTTLQMLLPDNTWDGRRLLNAALHVEIVGCFKEALLSDTHEVAPGDQLLRRLQQHIPPDLNLLSWVSDAVLIFIHCKFKACLHDLDSPDGGRSVIYEPEEDILEPKVRKTVDRMLAFLPYFLNQLAIQWAAWLPYEIQLVASDTPLTIYRFLNRRDYYYDNDEYWNLTPRRKGPDFYRICVRVAETLIASGWADLPFGRGIHEAIRLAWDVPRQDGTLDERIEARREIHNAMEDARLSNTSPNNTSNEPECLNALDAILDLDEAEIMEKYGEEAAEGAQAWIWT